MRTITENILINESPDAIWELLLKSHEYENWNPMFNYVRGDIAVRETISVEIQMKIDQMMEYADEEMKQMLSTMQTQGAAAPQQWKFKVTELVENERMKWKMTGIFGWILGGWHEFKLGVVQEQKTMFEISLVVDGLVVSFMPDKLFYSYNKILLTTFLQSFKWYVEEGSQTKHEL